MAAVREAHADGASRAALSGEVGLLRSLLVWPPIWVALAVTLAGMVGAYQAPHTYLVDVGSPRDQAYVSNFHARLEEGGRTYRWSDVYGYLAFPGLGGSRPFTLTIVLDPMRPVSMTLIVNGVQLASGMASPGWQAIQLAVDGSMPAVLESRDTVLEVRAPEFRTPDSPTEAKGVRIDYVQLEQAGSGGFITPPVARLGFLGGSVLLLYALVGRALIGPAERGRARRWGLAAALVYAGAVVAALASDHIAVSAAAQHAVLTLGSALGLLVGVEWLAGALRWELTAGQRRVLAVAVAGAFALRYGGMALPQSVIIDMPWHMKWLRTLLAGDWQSLYYPGGLSSVPGEWEVDLLIPKSPLFYFAAAPLKYLPFDLETSVKWLISLLDASVALLVFRFGMRVSGTRWAAVAGSGLYALMPLAFRAFAYGILPTIFAQCLATGALLALLARHRQRWGFGWWAALLVLVSLALLAFPTVALFLSMVVLATAFAWWVQLRGRPDLRRLQSRLPLLLAASWLLAIAAYYGLYITPVLNSVGTLLAPRSGGGSTVRWPGGFAELLAWTADYIVSLAPVLLAVVGLCWLFARPQVVSARRAALWLAAIWLSIAPLFTLVNYRLDMIGKHLFFTMPPVAVAGGVGLWALWRRGGWAALLASLALATVGWQGLAFWVERLVRASS